MFFGSTISRLRRKLVDYCPEQGDYKQQKHRNKVDRNAPITSKHVFPKRSAKMIDGTEKPKIPLKFAKREARYKNLATSRDFLGRHIKFCKQNTAMLIELREN